MSSPLPSRAEAWKILEAAKPPGWVLEHVEHVEAMALAIADLAIANGEKVDQRLVQIGAILHDVGRGQTQDARHAHFGAEALRIQDFPEDLVLLVERHTGAGITPEEAPSIGIPVRDYTPVTIEEKIVAHADNLYSGSKRMTMQQVRAKYEAKGLDAAFKRIQELHRQMSKIAGIDLESLQPQVIPRPN